jgi:hypothetical protein
MQTELQQAACAGKAPLSADVAKRIAGQRRGKGRKAYRCQFCRSWHLGSDQGSRRLEDRGKHR